jgi:DNA-binding transcriptional LysR family regulator
MFDWNDLKHFLAIARHGSTTAAAKALGVSQSTVQRRMVELERQLGRALLTRHAAGYELTPLGRELVPLAEDVGRTIEAFHARIRETTPDGRTIIRLTCPEPVIGRLKPLLERFHAQRPAYRIELVTSDRYLDLLKGEADVAFRSGDTDHALVGYKVADSVWGVYASSSYIERNGRPASISELARHTLVSLDESLSEHRLMQWIREVAPHAEVASRSHSILGLVQATKSGIGIAPLPAVIAEESGLIQVLGPIRELERTWKLLTHPGLRDTPRISALFDFVAGERDLLKTILG